MAPAAVRTAGDLVADSMEKDERPDPDALSLLFLWILEDERAAFARRSAQKSPQKQIRPTIPEDKPSAFREKVLGQEQPKDERQGRKFRGLLGLPPKEKES